MVTTLMKAQDIRVALVIRSYDDHEEVLTRFVRPSDLTAELLVIESHPTWYIGRTYLANAYGQEVKS